MQQTDVVWYTTKNDLYLSMLTQYSLSSKTHNSFKRAEIAEIVYTTHLSFCQAVGLSSIQWS